MKIIFFLAIVSLFSTGAWAFSDGDSTVAEVTVFKDRAYVKRHQTAKYEKGAFTIRFTGITPLADLDSFKAILSEKSQVRVLGIRNEKRFALESRNKQMAAYRADEEILKAQKQRLIDSVNVLNHERQNLDLLSAHYSDSFSLNLHQNSWSRNEFKGFLDLWSSRNQAANGSWFKLFLDFDALCKRIEMLDHKIAELSSPTEKETVTVYIDILAKERGTTGVDLHYLVSDAGWVPTYDLRVNGSAGHGEMEQHAYVWQKSGEDWSNVRLNLSNFREELNTNAPDISRETISYREVKKVQTQIAGKVEDTNDLVASSNTDDDKEEAEGETSVSKTFDIPGLHTIKSGTKRVKIFVAKKELTYKEHLELVAAQYPKVYRRGEMVNTFPWNLAAGTMYVYYDGNYIDQTWFEPVAQGKTFAINAGVEHNMVVSRWENSTTRNPSQLSSTRHFFKEIHTKIENFTDRVREVKVMEAVPVSEIKDVSVNFSTPDGKQELKKDNENDGWYSWQVAVPPRKSQDLMVKLDVAVPADFNFQW